MMRVTRALPTWLFGAALAGAVALAVACGSDDSGSNFTDPDGAASSSGTLGEGGDPSFASITVDPPKTTLDVVDATPKTVQLVAKGQPGDIVINGAQWAVDNAVLGGVDGNGLFTTSNQAGGVVHVTATYKGLSASAEVDINLSKTITSGNVPANAPSLFDPTGKTVVTTGNAKIPAIVYPVVDTMFPQNLYRVLFQWRGQGMPLFQLSFESPVLKASVYTDGVHATCVKAQTSGSCWESDQNAWTALAASNAGQTVTLKIRSVDPAAPGTIYESAPYVFHFSKKEVPGAIYYWSTTAAGVRRGAMGDPGPTNFYTPLQTGGKCVACHTLSKNGKLMAGDIGGENLGVVQVTNTVPPPVNFGPTGTPPVTYASSWATFDPDAKFVVQSRAGKMTLRDSTSGATVGANSGAIPLGAVLGIQPDWALDGKHIVFGQANKDRGGGTTLQWINTTINASDVTYGAVETLLPAAANTLYGYPMFNPTNDTIAFVKGKSIEKDVTDQLYILKAATGGQTPVALTRANTLVNDLTGQTGFETNMPTWAPTSGDVQWIAFASTRDYGFVLMNGSKVGDGLQQLWIAAIDVSKLGSGDDPSYPAFRVPFVELTENAHRPFWALDVLKPAGDAGVSDGGDQDAGACIGFGKDCTSGFCCPGTVCTDNGAGSYQCLASIN